MPNWDTCMQTQFICNVGIYFTSSDTPIISMRLRPFKKVKGVIDPAVQSPPPSHDSRESLALTRSRTRLWPFGKKRQTGKSIADHTEHSYAPSRGSNESLPMTSKGGGGGGRGWPFFRGGKDGGRGRQMEQSIAPSRRDSYSPEPLPMPPQGMHNRDVSEPEASSRPPSQYSRESQPVVPLTPPKKKVGRRLWPFGKSNKPKTKGHIDQPRAMASGSTIFEGDERGSQGEQQHDEGQSQHGQSQHGQSQHGQSQHGQSQYGQSQHGQSQHAQSQHSQDKQPSQSLQPMLGMVRAAADHIEQNPQLPGHHMEPALNMVRAAADFAEKAPEAVQKSSRPQKANNFAKMLMPILRFGKGKVGGKSKQARIESPPHEQSPERDAPDDSEDSRPCTPNPREMHRPETPPSASQPQSQRRDSRQSRATQQYYSPPPSEPRQGLSRGNSHQQKQQQYYSPPPSEPRQGLSRGNSRQQQQQWHKRAPEYPPSERQEEDYPEMYDPPHAHVTNAPRSNTKPKRRPQQQSQSQRSRPQPQQKKKPSTNQQQDGDRGLGDDLKKIFTYSKCTGNKKALLVRWHFFFSCDTYSLISLYSLDWDQLHRPEE